MRDLSRCELWLIRHAESTGNRDGIIQGHRDLPLTATGHSQAERLAERLRPLHFAGLYCSDLIRARDTAKYLEGSGALSANAERRLREVDTGLWSGLTPAQIALRFPEEWQQWQSRDPSMRRGQGESYREAAARIAGILDTLARAHPGERVLVVFHGTVIRLFLATVLGLDLGQAWRLGIANTSISRVRPFMPAPGAPGQPLGQVLSCNDLAHLEAVHAPTAS